MSKEKLNVVDAKWPAPDRVHAFTTTRTGGVSLGNYAELNLADHVGDDHQKVAENRRRLNSLCNLPSEPLWLTQVHGSRVVNATATPQNALADSSYADRPGIVCAVLTADCVPVFLCDRARERVGMVHVGWRGLIGGVVERSLERFEISGSDVIAWLGPAIGPRAFEIGEEVKSALHDGYPGCDSCFTRAPLANKWLADLYALVRRRLRRTGVDNCYCDESLCTFSQPDLFFSYRRDRECGRMASVIWIDH